MRGKAQINVGQRYHMLVTLRKMESKVHKEEAWVCLCDCGEETVALKTQLLRGGKKSCGCLRKQKPANALDLSGQIINGVKVIERSGTTPTGSVIWICECKCGNRFKANATLLKRGSIMSCGCQRPSQAALARGILQREKTVDGVAVPLLTKQIRSDSKTGIKGVRQRTRRGKVYYEPYITVKGKRIYGKASTTPSEAKRERERLEKIYHAPYIEALKEREQENENMDT